MTPKRMTPEREFILTALSRYLEQQPKQAKSEAIDLCAKYLEQHEKTSQLQEHCKLLEERIDELMIGNQVLRKTLECEQKKDIFSNSNAKRHIDRSSFVSCTSHNFEELGKLDS